MKFYPIYAKENEAYCKSLEKDIQKVFTLVISGEKHGWWVEVGRRGLRIFILYHL